jgi:hypothetical protein
MYMRYFPGGGVGHVYVVPADGNDGKQGDEAMSRQAQTDVDTDDIDSPITDIQPWYVPPELDESSDSEDSDGSSTNDEDELEDGNGMDIELPVEDELGADDGECSDFEDSGYATQ